MSVVFQTFRPDGTLQLDSTIPPFCFHSKATVTTVSTTGFSPHWSNSSPSSALIPMTYDADELIAVQMPTGYGYARYADLQYPGSSTWYHIYHTDAPVGSTVTYYKFVRGTDLATASHPVGLELFNEAGVRTYASSMRPAIITGMASNVGTVTTMTAGRSYASIAPSLAGHERYYFDGSSAPIENDKGQIIGWEYYGYSDSKLYGVRWNNSYTAELVGVSFSDMNISAGSPQPSYSEFFNIPISDVMYLDVTGL
ncbi:hypothetical protein P6144_00325 [Sphingomonas sp. HITSZ_GF]|uniref:hypothetical protein n=1 Tax=Sphingomonas sp. HITSZ_GF TaxID=3037247 RepID=UPI00240DDDD5|nr:hypothetical protein [Sphingomonas sp. HITSZ_GF]MDG2532081.1 hypothetical protein [Sphingomonas sp. HITSZ_GF]